MPEKYDELVTFLKRFRHVIWDWNGTVLNDSELAIRANNVVLGEHGLNPITLEDYRAKFTHPVIDYYRELGFDVSGDSFEKVGARFIELYQEGFSEVQVFEKIPLILSRLSEMGVKHSMLSAAHEPLLKKWVVERNVDQYFENVFGIDDIYAASKIERGKALLATIGRSSDEIALVGDTDHDFEVATELGVTPVLISNGHQATERLEKLTENLYY